MNERAIVLRYHEVALKGANRKWFEDRLAMNAKTLIQRAQGRSHPVEIKRLHGRIVLDTEWNNNTREALTRVFGLSSFSPMRKVKTDKESLLRAAVEEYQSYVEQNGRPKSFRVKTRRSDKALPEISTEIDRFVGSAVQDSDPSLQVDLSNPELVIGLEVRFNESFIWTEKIPAKGGLPVGSNGPVLCLLSGGLDSPVAAIQVLKRGSPVSLMHFYGAPFVGEDALEKVEALTRIVNRYQPEPEPLHVVPFGKIQEKIALVTHPKMRTVLYRRMMIRVANALAQKIGAQALITGESLGQVASQTVENLSTIDRVSTLPILRPLIAYNKDEIIEQAHAWGTFEVSVRPALDCCTLFADRHPALRTSPALAEEQESNFSVDELVQECLEGTFRKYL